MKKNFSQTDALLVSLLVAVNLAGFLFGVYFYAWQLEQVDPALWLFLIDCPLYVLLFSFVLIQRLVGLQSDFFNYLVAVGLFKYGVWTLVAIAGYHWFFLNPASAIWLSNSILFLLHIGMAAEGLTFLFKKIEPWMVAAALGWFLFNDYVDYWGPMVHPGLPPGIDLAPMAAYTVFSSIASCLLVYWLWKNKKWIRLGFLHNQEG